MANPYIISPPPQTEERVIIYKWLYKLKESINYLLTQVTDSATITIGALSGTSRTITITLLDPGGIAKTTQTRLFAYLTDSTPANLLTATAPSSIPVVGSYGVIIPSADYKSMSLITDTTGKVSFTLTNTSSTHSWYLVLSLSNEILTTSSIITI